MSKSYLSKEGYEKLKKELQYLKEVKKGEISKRITEALEHGDLKENFEYHSAKEALTQTMLKIRDLSVQLSNAEIIDETQVDPNMVLVGSKVKLLDLDADEEDNYTIVGAYEVDPLEGKISVDSPISQGLIGHKVGDEVKIEVPAGTLNYKILDISR